MMMKVTSTFSRCDDNEMKSLMDIAPQSFAFPFASTSIFLFITLRLAALKISSRLFYLEAYDRRRTASAF